MPSDKSVLLIRRFRRLSNLIVGSHEDRSPVARRRGRCRFFVLSQCSTLQFYWAASFWSLRSR